MKSPDYSKLDSMPSVDDAGATDSGSSDGTDGADKMDPELTMLAKEAGFTGDKAMALWQFVKACAQASDTDDQGA